MVGQVVDRVMGGVQLRKHVTVGRYGKILQKECVQ